MALQEAGVRQPCGLAGEVDVFPSALSGWASLTAAIRAPWGTRVKRRFPILAALVWLLGSSNALAGDADMGARTIGRRACGSCHMIPGIEAASGHVGPSLAGVAGRAIIAGILPNTPRNLASWVRDPQAIKPRNAMPTMDLSDKEVADIVAYLETLR